MSPALACHDALMRAAVENQPRYGGREGRRWTACAFDDPLDAVGAALQLQQALADPEKTKGIALRVRCGLHAGLDERSDNDFFGNAVTRAARIRSVAHDVVYLPGSRPCQY